MGTNGEGERQWEGWGEGGAGVLFAEGFPGSVSPATTVGVWGLFEG